MKTERTIKGVIFARSWYEAAKKVLPSEERLIFYEAVFSYAFTGAEPGSKKRDVKAMFEMVRPWLDSEEERYQERCERNRRNAQAKKPTAPSGTQSLPIATNTNTTTKTNTTTTTTTISLTRERERFLICGLFFLRGALHPAEELERFWQYYESLGWRNNKGAAIVKKVAAAKMWNLQEISSSIDSAIASEWYACMTACDTTRAEVFELLRAVVVEGGNVVLIANDVQKFAAIIDGECIAGLKRFAAALNSANVTYRSA